MDVQNSGCDKTKDNNTTGRFFEDHEVAAEIPRIDIKLTYRLKMITDSSIKWA